MVKRELLTGVLVGVTGPIVWLLLAILDAGLEGLFWLTVIAVILIIGTGVHGWLKRKA